MEPNMEQGQGQGGKEEAVVVEQTRFQALQSQVDRVKDIIKENVNRLLARGEQLDELQGKAEDLQAAAQDFKRMTQKVERSYCCKNVKLVVVIVVTVLIIILIIVLLATGVIPTSSGTNPPAPIPQP